MVIFKVRMCLTSRWRVRGNVCGVPVRLYRSAWSRAKPVKLKKLRYSSATMRLNSLLQRQTYRRQHQRTSLAMF